MEENGSLVTVGVSQLKNGLSKYLARVRAGRMVVVTNRGKPVARIMNMEMADLPESVKNLIASGHVRYVGKPRYIPTPMTLLPGDDGKVSVNNGDEQHA